MPYTASQTPGKAPARAGLLCCGGRDGGGGGISTTKAVKKGSIYLYGVFPAAGHHANAGGQRERRRFGVQKAFFFWPPAALPSRTRCRPSWRAPVGTSGASWLSIPSPKRETTDPALRSKIWLSPARDKGTVLFCTELHLRRR